MSVERRDRVKLGQIPLGLGCTPDSFVSLVPVPDYAHNLAIIHDLPIWDMTGGQLVHLVYQKYVGNEKDETISLSVNLKGHVGEIKPDRRRNQLRVVDLVEVATDSARLIGVVDENKYLVGEGGLLMVAVKNPSLDLIGHLGEPCRYLVDPSKKRVFSRSLMAVVDESLLLVARRGGWRDKQTLEGDLKAMDAMGRASEKAVVALSCGCVVCLSDSSLKSVRCHWAGCEFETLDTIVRGRNNSELALQVAPVPVYEAGRILDAADSSQDFGAEWLRVNRIADKEHVFRVDIGNRRIIDQTSLEGEALILGDDNIIPGKVYEEWRGDQLVARYMVLGVQTKVGENSFRPVLVQIFPEPARKKKK